MDLCPLLKARDEQAQLQSPFNPLNYRKEVVKKLLTTVLPDFYLESYMDPCKNAEQLAVIRVFKKERKILQRLEIRTADLMRFASARSMAAFRNGYIEEVLKRTVPERYWRLLAWRYDIPWEKMRYKHSSMSNDSWICDGCDKWVLDYFPHEWHYCKPPKPISVSIEPQTLPEGVPYETVTLKLCHHCIQWPHEAVKKHTRRKHNE